MVKINPTNMKWTDGWFWGSMTTSIFTLIGLVTNNNLFLTLQFFGSMCVALIIIFITALIDKKYRTG